MYSIKKILVGLDLSELDPTIITFASYLANTFSAEEIHFVNIIRSLSIPDAIKKEFPTLLPKALKERETQLKESVEKHIHIKYDTTIKFTIKQGQPAKTILSLSKKIGADVILVGRKNKLKGSGLLSYRLARRASCGLMIVPENTTPQIKKLLVPSDFSDYSIIAMQQAITIAKNEASSPEIVCQNVYTVPTGYHTTGKSYKEFAKIMAKNAEKNYKKFIKKFDLDGVKINPIYTLDEDDDPVEDIIRKARQTKADLIIIGAKGRTATSALFLGSMAERLIQYNNAIPLLVVRPKGKNAGLMDYIREL